VENIENEGFEKDQTKKENYKVTISLGNNSCVDCSRKEQSTTKQIKHCI